MRIYAKGQYMYRCMCVEVRGQFERVGSPIYHMDPRNWTKSLSNGGRCLCLLSYLIRPKKSSLIKNSNDSVINILFFHTHLLFLSWKLHPKLKMLTHLSSLDIKTLAYSFVHTSTPWKLRRSWDYLGGLKDPSALCMVLLVRDLCPRCTTLSCYNPDLSPFATLTDFFNKYLNKESWSPQPRLFKLFPFWSPCSSSLKHCHPSTTTGTSPIVWHSLHVFSDQKHKHQTQ